MSHSGDVWLRDPLRTDDARYVKAGDLVCAARFRALVGVPADQKGMEVLVTG